MNLGCVSYNFEKKGILDVDKENLAYSEDDIILLALDAGAEDVKIYDEVYEILTDISDFANVREKLEEAGLKFSMAEIGMIPKTTIQLDEERAEKLEAMIDRIEDLDDVQSVYHNAEY